MDELEIRCYRCGPRRVTVDKVSVAEVIRLYQLAVENLLSKTVSDKEGVARAYMRLDKVHRFARKVRT